MTANLQSIIEAAWDNRANLTTTSHPEVNAAVETVISDLNAGACAWPIARASASGR